MKESLVAPLACILSVCAFCYAQAPKPEASKPVATAPQAQPCVIVKRHVHKLDENMPMLRFHPHRPFDYVEGDYPPGFKWRSELSNGDVLKLQKKGGRIVIMRPDYEISDLEDARKQCQFRPEK